MPPLFTMYHVASSRLVSSVLSPPLSYCTVFTVPVIHNDDADDADDGCCFSSHHITHITHVGVRICVSSCVSFIVLLLSLFSYLIPFIHWNMVFSFSLHLRHSVSSSCYTVLMLAVLMLVILMRLIHTMFIINTSSPSWFITLHTLIAPTHPLSLSLSLSLPMHGFLPCLSYRGDAAVQFDLNDHDQSVS